MGLYPRSVASGDFNSDGHTDLAVANTGYNSVSILLNQLGRVSISVSNANRVEENSGTTPFTFSVTRDGNANGFVSVDYVVRGYANAPADANDFGGTLPSGTVTFEEGEKTKTITIYVSGDATLEANERFAVTLSNPIGGVPLAKAVAIGTIRDDDHDLVYSGSGNTMVTATVLKNGHLQVKVGDVIQPDIDPAVVHSLTINGGSRNDVIDLTGLSRRLYSALTSIVLNGNAGNDRITGSAEFSEVISGGAGDDVLNGGVGGNDRLVESAASNLAAAFSLKLTDTTLSGGLGRDRLLNFEEAVLTGGERGDRLDASKFTGKVTLSGTGGNDTLLGGRGHDSLNGGGGLDSLIGNFGNDTLSGGADNDRLEGGFGTNQLQETGDVSFKITNAALIGLGSDSLTSMETAWLTGGTGSNRLDAASFTIGPVTLDGGEGNDSLLGGSKNDLLNGSDGRDLLIGGDGTDSLTGGNDDDTLMGNAGNDIIDGGSGNDVIDGGDGNDHLQGSDGDDAIRGGNGNDTVSGGKGSDILVGSSGNDSLSGDTGDDTLLGDAGNDTLDGGSDINIINPGYGRNTISDGFLETYHLIDTSFTFDFDVLLTKLR
ncbi:MAG: hypothetical protein NT013_02805 [Planctomycetia bacterium]|nr:hypothetical protein [Planctomycetia bacterium]